MTKIYRLQSAQYGLPNDIISGRGAEITGGRWNPVGVPLVYASLSIELAALEYLVHYFEGFPNGKLPSLLMATMEIPNETILKIEADMLPKDWRDFPAPNSLQSVSNQWIKNRKYAALQIPTAVHSAQTEMSYNVLLNPLHEQIQANTITKIEPFYFDNRYQKPQIQGTQMNDLIEKVLGG